MDRVGVGRDLETSATKLENRLDTIAIEHEMDCPKNT
jgi:hypothetical protein